MTWTPPTINTDVKRPPLSQRCQHRTNPRREGEQQPSCDEAATHAVDAFFDDGGQLFLCSVHADRYNRYFRDGRKAKGPAQLVTRAG